MSPESREVQIQQHHGAELEITRRLAERLSGEDMDDVVLLVRHAREWARLHTELSILRGRGV